MYTVYIYMYNLPGRWGSKPNLQLWGPVPVPSTQSTSAVFVLTHPMTWEKTSIIFVTSLCDFDICAFTCHAKTINRICSIAGNPGSYFPWSMSSTFSFTKLQLPQMASCAPPPWLPKHLGVSSCTGLSSISWIIVPQKMINKHEYHESTVFKKNIPWSLMPCPRVTNFPCHDNKHYKYHSYSPVATSFSSDFKLPVVASRTRCEAVHWFTSTPRRHGGNGGNGIQTSSHLGF